MVISSIAGLAPLGLEDGPSIANPTPRLRVDHGSLRTFWAAAASPSSCFAR